MKTLVIYHKNCFDGMCAAWVVSRAYPDATFKPMHYGENIKDAVTEYLMATDGSPHFRCIVVDISFPREYMIWLSGCGDLTVLDHHKTAQENCEGLPFCRFDMNESGASLAFKYFFPGKELPRLVRYIKDRDLWLFKEEFSKEVNAYIQLEPMTISDYNKIAMNLESYAGLDEAVQVGKGIERYKDTHVKNAAAKAIRVSGVFDLVDPKGIEFPAGVRVVNTTMLFSEVGHEICKMFPDAPFAATYFDRLQDGKRQWSLRSIGDYDVSAFAKLHGGGGHKNAAGFETRL